MCARHEAYVRGVTCFWAGIIRFFADDGVCRHNGLDWVSVSLLDSGVDSIVYGEVSGCCMTVIPGSAALLDSVRYKHRVENGLIGPQGLGCLPVD
jgi:hypothetical protein